MLFLILIFSSIELLLQLQLLLEINMKRNSSNKSFKQYLLLILCCFINIFKNNTNKQYNKIGIYLLYNKKINKNTFSTIELCLYI